MRSTRWKAVKPLMNDRERATGVGLAGERGASESDAAIKRLAPELVHHLFSAARTLQVHDLNNRAAQRALAELMSVVSELLRLDGRLVVTVSSDFLLINENRVHADSQHIGPIMFLVQEMKDRDVEGLELDRGVRSEDVGVFLKTFFRDYPQETAYETLVREMARQAVSNIKLHQWVEREKRFKDESHKQDNIRERSNQVFFRTTVLVGEVLRGIEQKRAIQVQKAERLTQQMVDIIQADESILVGLTSLKDFDEGTFRHSVNVSILSMLMADRLGLPKTDIAQMGVAGLLHDIGKTYVPQSILNSPTRLEGRDWELMKYHTIFGVKELSRVKALREVADAMFVALQHHVHYNMNGYPQRPGGWKLRLFSRIVTVADYFDAMTTPRIYQDPCTPDKALLFILRKSGEIFDPVIAKVFVQAMGVYPIGTLVELDDGQRAIVVRQNERRRFIHRPVVMPIGPKGATGETIDLSQSDGGTNTFRRSIVSAMYDRMAEIARAGLFVTDSY